MPGRADRRNRPPTLHNAAPPPALAPSDLVASPGVGYGSGMRSILLLTCVLLACGRDATGNAAGGLTREKFVDTYVELGIAQRSSTSPDEFQARKEDVLRRNEVTEEQLQSFVNQHGRELRFMASVWDSVRSKLVNDALPQ